MRRSWTFLSNHTMVLAIIARNPRVSIRDVALEVDVTERCVQRIVSELSSLGYLIVHKEGRCNRYEVALDQKLGLRGFPNLTIGDLISLIASREVES